MSVGVAVTGMRLWSFLNYRWRDNCCHDLNSITYDYAKTFSFSISPLLNGREKASTYFFFDVESSGEDVESAGAAAGAATGAAGGAGACERNQESTESRVVTVTAPFIR